MILNSKTTFTYVYVQKTYKIEIGFSFDTISKLFDVSLRTAPPSLPLPPSLRLLLRTATVATTSGQHCRKSLCSNRKCSNSSSKRTRWCATCRKAHHRDIAKECASANCKNTAIPHKSYCTECRCLTPRCYNSGSQGTRWCTFCRAKENIKCEANMMSTQCDKTLASGQHCRTPQCSNTRSKRTRWCATCRKAHHLKIAKKCASMDCKNTAIPHRSYCTECRCSTPRCYNSSSNGTRWCKSCWTPRCYNSGSKGTRWCKSCPTASRTPRVSNMMSTQCDKTLASGQHCRTPQCSNTRSKRTRWCATCRKAHHLKIAKKCASMDCKNTAIPHWKYCREHRHIDDDPWGEDG